MSPKHDFLRELGVGTPLDEAAKTNELGETGPHRRQARPPRGRVTVATPRGAPHTRKNAQ